MVFRGVDVGLVMFGWTCGSFLNPFPGSSLGGGFVGQYNRQRLWWNLSLLRAGYVRVCTCGCPAAEK